MTEPLPDPPFEEVRRILEEALEQPESERTAWVEAACATDAALLREVRVLLDAAPDDAFLAPPDSLAFDRIFEETDLSGRRVGEFTLVRPLGRGGMGVVYLAEQERPRRPVALKLLEGLPSASARRRFEFEAELLASLRHPGIAQVYAAGAVDLESLHLPYFAMEYVEDARPLPDHADAERLDTGARLELFLEVCAAVQHGHAKGVLHRDLKPANLLVGSDGRVKVIDFGIARAAANDEPTQLTRTGELVGTLAYMAPERVTGTDTAGDVASDVYALGIVLYELVARQRAFDLAGLGLPEAIRRVGETSPVPLHRRRPDLPRDLSWITLRALEREPARRYASVAALAEDVHRFLNHEAVAAGPPSVLYRVRKFVRRHRTGVLAAVALLATVAFALIRGVQGRAREERLEAQSATNAVRLLRVRDSALLDELRAEAETELYPPVPARIDDFERWLARAEDLGARLAETRATLTELEGTEDVDDVQRWLADSLAEYAAELDRFFDPENGLVADVRERLEFASTIEERSVTGARARELWSAATAALRDPEASPYGGLDLVPQLGLLPLGPDPESGLWEFAHLRSGVPATRAADGKLAFDGDTGIVLVLIPGGRVTLGAIAADTDALVDPSFLEKERPVVEVDLAPYFLSKFELTQGQWVRVAGANPSRDGLSPLYPVDSVDWTTSVRMLERLDLVLPTEAQWEAACRARTRTPWWFGAEPGDVTLRANVHLESTAPVGSFPPNPFGFHDLLGNVVEWCRDGESETYTDAVFLADSGERLTAAPARRVRRGSSLGMGESFRAATTRSSQRFAATENSANPFCGIRPARPVRIASD